MSLFHQLCYSIDLFKSPFFFLHEKKEKISTPGGVFFSLLVIGYLLYQCFNSNMYLKINPYIIDQTLKVSHRNLMNLGKSNFSLAASINNDALVNFVDPSIFTLSTIEFKFETINGTSHSQKLTKPMHSCSKADFPENSTMYDDLHLKNAYCPEDGNFSIEGYWDEISVRYFRVDLVKCINDSSSNITCKSNEEIKKFLTGKFMTIYYQEFNFEVDSYEKPITVNYANLFQRIDADEYKTMRIFLKEAAFLDDDNYFFKKTAIDTFFKTDYLQFDQQKNIGSNLVFNTVFYVSPNKQHLNRRYQKFDEVLAQLGGSGAALKIIVNILLYSYTRFKIMIKIMGFMFKIYTPNAKKIRKVFSGKKMSGKYIHSFIHLYINIY